MQRKSYTNIIDTVFYRPMQLEFSTEVKYTCHIIPGSKYLMQYSSRYYGS